MKEGILNMKMYQVRHVRFVNSSVQDVPYGELTASLARAQAAVDDFNNKKSQNISRASACDACGYKSIFVKDTTDIESITSLCTCTRFSPIQTEFARKNIENEMLIQIDCANRIRVEDASERMYVDVVER